MSLFTITTNCLLSLLGGFVSLKLIQEYIPIFIQRGHYGNDQCKVSNAPIPEPMGVITAAVYLIIMFIFIPFPFLEWTYTERLFPHDKFLAFLSAIISICTAILLGFADDMLDLRWRHKLLFPTLSSLPVLMVYYVQGSSTTIVVPKIARSIVSFLGFEMTTSLDINLLYYVFMGMVIVFCTNSINIYAGINGLEVGQSLVIASSITLYNVIQLYRLQDPIECYYNWLSIYFLLPFITTSLILYNFNKYPARVFVGDTYCYWAGMTLAVVAILGHFSKTAMLFFIPQAFNFIYSTPQLFHLVPCPRHRLPKFDSKTDTVGMSFAEFKKSELNRFGQWVVTILSTIGLLFKEDFNNDGEKWIRLNNFTVINLVLKFVGPVREGTLTKLLLLLQVFSSILAFIIRFFLARILYDVVL
ncbi:unnamed protein product, partial [Mesorhabditis belari]|uniref:UDP-N-acetylglucosamine--dolichyl-phosphate N-acetylglucosaminephosphotransferase n=1 Tax=Mesorhabditis belari TaxID=2138241 RepID=A0AAF3EC36_9BILA